LAAASSGHDPTLFERLERHVERTRGFFRRHGGKAIVLGPFATGVAALVPFVAGMS
jgi:membrane protein DedA with SNARE-associated domain